MLTEILSSLNDMQRKAVEATEGPSLILAGAGSGKTKTLTHRIAYILSNHNEPKPAILAVTFTNKAAKEMRSRTEQLLGYSLAPSYTLRQTSFIGTFHSLSARILRHEITRLGYERGFVIYDVDDQTALIKEILKAKKIDEKELSSKSVLNTIMTAKDKLITPEQFQKNADDFYMEQIAGIYPIYQATLKRNNALDFNDLIMKTVETFQQFPDVLDRYQELFKYCMVDEYQDTNHAQYILVKLLASKRKNLCVVGDDWQGIYSWRGADIQNILNFKRDYPEALEIKLEQNYRSTKNIIQAAQTIIDKNVKRTNKQLWTENEAGKKILIYEAEDEHKEGEAIVQSILSTKGQYASFGILYRTNAQSRSIEEAFVRGGLPYKIVRGLRFYDRKEVKDALAYLFAIVNPTDSVSLKRIVNEPPRGIGKQTIDKLIDFAYEQEIPLFEALTRVEEIQQINPRTAQRILDFVDLLRQLNEFSQAHNASETLQKVLEETNFKDFLLDETEEGRQRYENVIELFSVAQKFDDIPAPHSLESFLEEIALINDGDTMENTDNVVMLMTLHAAKGLEFDFVFIAGMEDNIFPNINSKYQKASEEEERRLCYVGLTRARKQLMLLYTSKRTIYGKLQRNPRSCYLEEIPEELATFIKPQAPVVAPPAEERPKYYEPEVSYRPAAPYKPPVTRKPAASRKPEVKQPIVKREIPKPKRVGPFQRHEYKPGMYKEGDNIEHEDYGEGIVTGIRGDILTVSFFSGSVKKISAKIAPLMKLS